MSSITVQEIKDMMDNYFKSDPFLKLIENAVTNAVDKKFKEMEVRLEELEEENERLKGALNDLEQYGRRNNLRIYGLNKNRNKNIEEKDLEKEVVNEINLKMKCNIVGSQIEACHYMDKGKSSVIIKFTSRKTRDLVFSNKKLLKGSQLSVAEDLSKRNYILLKNCQKFSTRKIFGPITVISN